jgi:hypothetical protein
MPAETAAPQEEHAPQTLAQMQRSLDAVAALQGRPAMHHLAYVRGATHRTKEVRAWCRMLHESTPHFSPRALTRRARGSCTRSSTTLRRAW